MKIKILLTLLLLASATAMPAATNDLTSLLQQGLLDEEANRDLTSAIADYQALASQFDRDRQIAATAVYRLGECYRKLGQTNDAVAAYQRLIKDFGDQQDLVTLSRQNLTGLGAAPGSTFTERLRQIIRANATPETQVNDALQVQKQVLTDEIKVVEQQLAAQEVQVKTGTAVQTSVFEIQKNLDELKVRLAALDAGQPANSTPAATDVGDEDRELQRLQDMIQNSPDLVVDNGDALCNAANAGQLRVATFLLEHGTDANVKRSNGDAPIVLAAIGGQKSMVELLLARGADVNARSANGATALLAATENNYKAVVQTLLAHKADVNLGYALLNNKDTPLHIAADKGYTSLVQILLAAGANPGAKDDLDDTPLLKAAEHGCADSIKLLLAAGADPNAQNHNDRTPLSYAAQSGSPESVKLLLAAKADPNPGRDVAPLVCAIAKRDAASAEMLLQAGANPNWYGLIKPDISRPANIYNPVTPLYLAVVSDQLPLVQMLLKYKADPNDRQIDNQAILFFSLNKTNILETLLNAGAKVDPVSPDEEQWTPLGAVARQNLSPAAAEILLKHGANPNVVNRNGVTPLHFAAYALADPKIFELLLNAGANPNVRSSNGKTPLDEVMSHIPTSPPPNANPFLFSRISPDDVTRARTLADLLRQHGALDHLPDWDRISVVRPAINYWRPVFLKGTNNWNHFTLLELIFCYDTIGGGDKLAFGDLSRILIHRPGPDGFVTKQIAVNLLDASNHVDITQDVPVEFGDTVEIPEREHTLAENGGFLKDEQSNAILNYFRRKAGAAKLIVTGGSTVDLPLQEGYSQIGLVLVSDTAKGALTSNSDLSRVRVSRHEPDTGKEVYWTLDCSHMIQHRPDRIYPNNNAPDLWLRNGDVIEVPEKP